MTTYTIYQASRAVESHEYPNSALRAFLILVAHELRNGRDGSTIAVTPPLKCSLEDVRPPIPKWVVDALGEERLTTFRHKSGTCGCGSTKYPLNHLPQDHSGWEP